MTITPWPCLTIRRTTACETKKTLFTFTLKICSNVLTSNSYLPCGSLGSTNTRGLLMPALFTTPQISPLIFSAVAARFSTSSGSVTSVCTYFNLGSLNSPSLRSPFTTVAPLLINSLTIAAPIPDEPPVTTIVLPSKPNQSDIFDLSLSLFYYMVALTAEKLNSVFFRRVRKIVNDDRI